MPRKIILILVVAVVLGASGAAFWQFGIHGESGNNQLTLYGNVDDNPFDENGACSTSQTTAQQFLQYCSCQ